MNEVRTRIKDIATALELSASTVQSILRNEAGFRDETRRRVFAKAKELHYRPNSVARSLVTRNSHLLGVVVKAEGYARKALALNPNQSSNYVILAKVLRKVGGMKSDEAVSNLKRALALDPSDALAKQELALCYEERSDYATAEELLREIVNQAPDVLSAHVILSRIYHREHKVDEENAGKRVIERMESKMPGE